MKLYDIVAVIDGKGRITFIKVEEDKISDFVAEKADEGYLVSVVTNGNIKKLTSGEIIEFDIEESF